MEGAEAIAKGISGGGLEFIIGLCLVVIAALFVLLMKQRDRYELKQEENKNELLAVYDRHVQQGQQSLEMMQAQKKALEKLLSLLPKPRALLSGGDPEQEG